MKKSVLFMKSKAAEKAGKSWFSGFTSMISKGLVIASCALFFAQKTNAQIAITVTGNNNTTPALASTYTSMASALVDLNNVSAMSGPVVLTCASGSSETAPVKGFVLGSASLNAAVSAVNSITINKSGAGAVTINASVGTSNGATASPDGMFYLNGADFVTIDGLTFNDANSATATVAMEFGVALFKLNAGDGSNNNTIQNCVFNMQRINNNAGSGPMFDGSMGIMVVNSTALAATTNLTPTNGGTIPTNGTNSNNKFYSNTINGGNIGIALNGFAATIGVGPAPIATTFLGDINNDIGGSTVANGNSILNYGGGAATNPAAGIRLQNQWSANVSNNIVNNNNGTGINHATTLRGIFVQAAASANTSINNNTLTVKSGAATSQMSFIENASGGTALGNTVSISNNIFTNCTYSTQTSGAVYGIWNNATTPENLIISGNIFNPITLNNTAGTGAVYFINNTSAVKNETITANQFINQSLKTTGAIYLINNSYSAPANGIKSITSNSVITGLVRTAAGGAFYGYYDFGSSPSTVVHTIANNNFSNVNNNTSASLFYGFYSRDYSGSNPTLNCYNNVLSSITYSGTGSFYGFYLGGFSGTIASPNAVYNNIVSNINSGSSSAIQYAFAIDAQNLYLDVYNNSITSNTLTATAGRFAGIYALGSSNLAKIYNNTITNLLGAPLAATSGVELDGVWIGGGTQMNVYQNKINSFTTPGSVFGYTVSGGTQINIYEHKVIGANDYSINNLNSLGFLNTNVVEGIRVNAGTTVNIFKNNIYNLNNTGNPISPNNSVVNGLSFSGGTTVNAYNNLISNLNTPNLSFIDNLRGISVSSSGAGTSYNLYNNTIFLNGTSTAANFGSSGVYHAGSATSTIAKLDLQNNIVINNSSAIGAGIVAAFKRNNGATAGSLANYANTSNKNLFLAGTPSTSNLIFHDGVASAQTMSAYIAGAYTSGTVAPRDANSFTESAFNPATFFTSTAPTNANYLQPQNGLVTQAESGGNNLTSVFTDDYAGLTRPVAPGTSYDLGAWEFTGTTPAPVILFSSSTPTFSPSQCVAASRTIDVNITSAAGTVTSATLYYSFNGVAQTPVTMTNASSSLWTGVINAATPGNAIVTWSVVSFNSLGLNASFIGTSYSDEPTTGITASATAVPNPVCAGSTSTLSLSYFNNSAASPTYALPPAVTNPTSDEDFANVTIANGANIILNNSSANNSLIGTIGTAAGTPGSYSDFTSFGTYVLNKGVAYTFSLSSSTSGPTNWNNALAMYIDYNRNGVFTDAGELVYTSPATISGPHTRTGGFTVPAFASFGLTRMRVISNEGLITSPTQFVSYGEYEEYSINIQPLTSGLTWYESTNLIGTSNPQTTIVNASATYTGTAILSGCPISGTVAIVANPLPTAVTAANSSQCGLGVPTASVNDANGFTTPNYNWYNAATGGTLLQSSSANTYTTAIATSSVFYVSVANPTTNCESPLTAVTVSVTIPDPVSVVSTASAICLNQSFTLTASNTAASPVQNYAYSWLCSTPGSGATVAASGSQVVITPSAPGNFAYTLTGVDLPCVTTTVITVNVNPNPVITLAEVSPTVVCSNNTVSLTAQSIPAQTATSSASGNGTLFNSSSAYPSPFGNYYWGAKQQFLFTAAELTAMGLVQGNITSIAFDIQTAVTTPLTNYYVSAKSSTLTTLTTTFETGLTTLFNAPTYVPSSGLGYANNTINFNTPFYWNGTTGIVFEICFNNGSWTNNASCYYTTTTNGSCVYFNQDAAGVCANPTGVVSSNRPNIKLGGQVGVNLTNNYSWSWVPTTPAINTASGTIVPTNLTSSPVTNVYTVTSTNLATGCFATASVSLLVNPLPTSPVATNTSQCGFGVPTSSVSGGINYNWYASPTSTNILQSGPSNNFSSPIGATTTWYVAAFDNACESATRTPVTSTVVIPDPVAATTNSVNLCVGGTNSVVLNAVQTGTTNAYFFTWNATPVLGSGMPSPVTGISQIVTPTLPGSYVYNVTAFDGVCTTLSTVTVNLSNPPVITTASVNITPSVACSGTPVNLNAYAVTPTPSYALPPAVGQPLADEDFANVTIADGSNIILNNTTANGSLVGTIGTALGTPGGYSDFTSFGPYNLNMGQAYTFSLSSSTSGTSYLNALAMYIDYNRNGVFTDAGELVYTSPTTISGPHTVSGTFTVPTTANFGVTRMRLISNEGFINSPTQAVTWGEYEEYTINLIDLGTNNCTWQWNPGAINSNTAIVTALNTSTIVANQIYTATATNSVTGCSNTATVSLVVNPLPSAPLTFDASQCGIGISTASVSGSTNYNWYATPTSTSIIQSGSSSNFTNAISSTTSWYVSAFDGLCESAPRVTLTGTVTTPPVLSVNTPTGNVCANSIYTLTVSSPTANFSSYVWSPVTNLYTDAAATVSYTGGSAQTLYYYSTSGGVSNYTVSSTNTLTGCSNAVTFSLSTELPTLTASANPTVICSGAPVNLNGVSYVLGPQTVPTGYCTPTNSGSACINLVSINQLLRNSACEAGNYVDVLPSITTTNLNPGSSYTFSITTNGTAIVSVWFDWNRNGVFEPTEWYQPYINAAAGSVVVTVPSNANFGLTKMRVRSRLNGNTNGSGDACLNMGSGETEDYTINIMNDVTSSYSWQWNPGAINSNTAIVNPVNAGSAPTTQIYTLSITNPTTGCSATATVGILVNPIPATPVASNSVQCGSGIPTASVSGPTNFNWYAAPASTTIIQSGASTNFTNSINATTTWYVVSYDGTCESPAVALTQSVTPAPALTVLSPTAATCANAIQTLSVTSTLSSYASYIWASNANLFTDAAATIPYTGGSAAILYYSSNTNGATNYTVTGSNTVTGCANAVTFSVTTDLPPITAFSIPTVICSGANVNLFGQSLVFGPQTSTTYVAPPAVSSPLADEDFGNITISQGANVILNNTTGYNSLVGTIGTAVGTPGGYSDFTSFGPYNLSKGQFYNFSLSSIQPGNFSNALAIYIDYNRNGVFTDLGEQVYTSAVTTPGPHTETGIFSVPATASLGVTRMRVISNEGLINSSTQAVTWGEYEEYTVNIVNNITSSYAWQWNPGAINSNNAAVNPVNTSAIPANQVYTVTLTNTLTGCSNTAPVSILVNPIPTVSIVSSNSLICTGNSATLTGAGATNYTWTTFGNTPSITVTPSATVVYTLTGESFNCSSSTTATLQVNVTPTVSAVSSSSAICAGSNATLTASGATSYTWAGVGTTSAVTVAPSTTTVYSVVGETNGCSNTTTISLTANPVPTVSAASSNSLMCIGSTATLTAAGATNYTWSSSGTASTETVSPSATSVYTVTGETNNCTNTATVSVSINTIIPTVTAATSNATLCAGLPATLTAAGAINYTWTSVGNTQAVTVNPTVTTIYTVTGEDNACTNTATVAIAVTPNPLVVVTPSSSAICIGSSATLTASGANTYTWTNFGNTTSISITPTSTAIYTVTGEAGSCVTTVTVPLFVNIIPTVTAVSSSPYVCIGSSATLTAGGAINYTWTTIGNTQTVSVIPISSTIFSVTGEANGCYNTTTVSVGVGSVTPVVSVSASSPSICSGNSATLTASGANTYTWNPIATSSVVIVNPSANTSYTVTGEIDGCKNTTTLSLNVIPTPTVSASASQTVLCVTGETGSSILTASSSAASYSWSNGSTTSSIAVTPTLTTTYSVTVTNAGCSSAATVTVNVTDCTGLQEQFAGAINIYPNPTNGVVNVAINSQFVGTASIEVYDVIGKLLIQENLVSEVTTVNTSKLKQGIYMFKVVNDNQTIKVSRIIKQ